MRNSELHRTPRSERRPPLRRVLLFIALLLVSNAWTSRAEAQPAKGFAVERFYPSAAGGGWLVMDELGMHGGFGGAIEISGGYARKPLDVASPDGTQRVALVSSQAFADFSVAATYERFRLYLNFSTPLAVAGESGTLGTYELSGPSVDLGKNPDTLSDPRVGFDARLLGAPGSALRVGAGAQLIIPSGDRADYLTDGTFRGMFRLLFAGDVGRFMYAGQLGMHLRPLDDSPAPGSPRGSELLFGIAAGPRLSVGTGWAVVVGPEIYGETALRSFFGGTTTGLEALLTGRLEGVGTGRQLRVKVGAGGGLDPHFGAPQWRIVFAVELFDQR
jgi:hypothetical protein